MLITKLVSVARETKKATKASTIFQNLFIISDFPFAPLIIVHIT